MTTIEFEIEKNAIENLVYANYVISCEKCDLHKKYDFNWERHAGEEEAEAAKKVWLALEETERFLDKKIAEKRMLLDAAKGGMIDGK